VPTRASQATPAKAVKPSPRERLLQAAGELFYAEGVQSVGIDRVIERAGVAKASLYSTFGSKEQLVCAYLDARHAQTLGRLRAAVDVHRGGGRGAGRRARRCGRRVLPP
jgi:AcrR family transcriptional regulator